LSLHCILHSLSFFHHFLLQSFSYLSYTIRAIMRSAFE
jgi:hypothetical protein